MASLPVIKDFDVIEYLALRFIFIREGLSVQLILHLTGGPGTGILPGTTVWCLTGGVAAGGLGLRLTRRGLYGARYVTLRPPLTH